MHTTGSLDLSELRDEHDRAITWSYTKLAMQGCQVTIVIIVRTSYDAITATYAKQTAAFWQVHDCTRKCHEGTPVVLSGMHSAQ